MKKIRLIRTTIKEYVPNPEYYEPGMTIEQMAELDAGADDWEMLFSDCETDTVTYEIVEEESQ